MTTSNPAHRTVNATIHEQIHLDQTTKRAELFNACGRHGWTLDRLCWFVARLPRAGIDPTKLRSWSLVDGYAACHTKFLLSGF